MEAANLVTPVTQGRDVLGHDPLGGMQVRCGQLTTTAHSASSTSPKATSRSWSIAILTYRCVESGCVCPRKSPMIFKGVPLSSRRWAHEYRNECVPGRSTV